MYHNREPFDFPTLEPSPRERDHSRSKRPLVIFGERGNLNRRTMLRSEEAAVLERRTSGSGFPNRYLGWWVPLARGANEDSRRHAFRTLLLLLSLSRQADPNPAGVLVPMWDELERESPQVAELLRVVCDHTLTVATRASTIPAGGFAALIESAQLSLTSRPVPVPLLRVDARGGAKRLQQVRKVRSDGFVTNPRHHLEWLNGAVPSALEVYGPIFGVTSTSNDSGGRDFGAARDEAVKLSNQGCSRSDIARYLAAYGFVNSKDLHGVWPEQRLAEVVAVTR